MAKIWLQQIIDQTGIHINYSVPKTANVYFATNKASQVPNNSCIRNLKQTKNACSTFWPNSAQRKDQSYRMAKGVVLKTDLTSHPPSRCANGL